MASTFDWIKLAVENSKILIPLLLLLLSTTGYTVNDNLNKSKEIKASHEQIANIANHYTTPKVAKKSTCGDCLYKHEREYH